MEHTLNFKADVSEYVCTKNPEITICFSYLRDSFDVPADIDKLAVTISDSCFPDSTPVLLNRHGFWIPPNGKRHWLYSRTTQAILKMFGIDPGKMVGGRFNLDKDYTFYVQFKSTVTVTYSPIY